MVKSKPDSPLLVIGRYIAILLGALLGNYLISWLLQILFFTKVENTTLLVVLNLIPLFAFLASIVILLRFVPTYKPKSDPAESILLGQAGRKYIIESFLMGIVFIIAFRSCPFVIAWVVSIAGR